MVVRLTFLRKQCRQLASTGIYHGILAWIMAGIFAAAGLGPSVAWAQRAANNAISQQPNADPALIGTLPYGGANARNLPQNGPLAAEQGGNGQSGPIVIWPGMVNVQRKVRFMEYRLNQDLTFDIEYRYLATLFPYAKNEATQADHSVPEGWYRMTLAVLLPLPSGEMIYISSFSKIVRMQARRIAEDISFRIPTTLGMLMHALVVELTPLQANQLATTPDGEVDPLSSNSQPLPNTKSYLVEVPFVPNQNNTHVNGKDTSDPPYDTTVYSSLYDFTTRQAAAQITRRWHNSGVTPTPEEYAQKRHLEYLSLESPALNRVRDKMAFFLPSSHNPEARFQLAASAEWTNAACKILIEMARKKSDSADLNALNEYWSRAQNHCTKQPESALIAQRVIFSAGIDAAKKLGRSLIDNSSLNTSATFSINRSRSEDVFVHVAFKPFAVLMKALPEKWDFLPFDVGAILNFSNSRSKSESQSATDLKRYIKDTLVLELPLQNIRPCLELQLSAPLVGNPQFRGLLICGDVVEKSHVEELYMTIVEAPNSSPTTDFLSEGTNRSRASFRGFRDSSNFLLSMLKTLTADHDSKPLPFEFARDPEKYFRSVSPPIAGVVQTPILLKEREVHSFSNLLLNGKLRQLQLRFAAD